VILRFIRLAVSMLRPPLFVLFMMFAAIGLAQAGRAEELHPGFTVVLVVIAGWFVNATVVNDLADELIDRVNFPAVGRRPLASGEATRRELQLLGMAAGSVSLVVGWAVNWRVGMVVVIGLALSAAYSLPPFRISGRGGLASILLPAGYVAFPFLVGVLSVQPSLSREQLILLAGLWVSFIGRILLKDFRDVEGDAMFGKRTFLLRHGRRITCMVSAACWTAGSATLLLLIPVGSPVIAAFVAFLGCALYGLRQLARDSSRFEEWAIIAAIAMIGRAMAVTLLAYFSMLDLGHSLWRHVLVTATLTVLFICVSWSVLTMQKPVAKLETASARSS
jgi:4-hydroxybenzoate polyprenyltransferase